MSERDVCEVICDSREKTAILKQQIDQSKNIVEVTKLFKALSDETRMKVAYALTLEKELCVCDVAEIVGASTATTSHHLRHLKSLGLAKYRKEGKLVYYSLDDDHVKQLIRIAFAHQEELVSRG
ncbi:ArsR/SmtB family transcription factor [Neobacillus dielmonensis]|uniref:ArsR/SmtB family transcription factor n=1 Tax=Neobacillus dielmonensis TaxID=1347369 RepID=UPI0005A8F70D|nr:metalloregulator ArsR/SmtB family transcription factor [Neobacillus dielmonensis]